MMPELPEAQTIVNDLNTSIRGCVINDTRVFNSSVLAGPYSPELVHGTPIKRVERVGKMILFRFMDDANLLSSLRMTGQYVWGDYPYGAGAPPHVRAAFLIADRHGNIQDKALLFRDIRRFGRLFFAREKELREILEGLRLGPDPLELEADQMFNLIRTHKKPIKSILMDQHIISGIGNIYSAEILFAARISPFRLGTEFTEPLSVKLHRASLKILTAAIKERGSTVTNYESPNGKGGYQRFHKVYGKGKKPCPVCRNILRVAKIGGRSTVYCERCQKN
jgi:formamidopyrimidine-DNA glycosylase